MTGAARSFALLATAAACATADPVVSTQLASAAPPGGPVRWKSYRLPPRACVGIARSVEAKRPLPLDELVVLSSEKELRDTFCVPSDLDWTQHRLAARLERMGSPFTEFRGVARVGGTLVVSLHQKIVCQGVHYGDELEVVAAVIPAGREPVEVEMTSDPPRDCSGVP